MIPVMILNWLKRNFSICLLLMAGICLSATLGYVVRGATWSLLMPVGIAASLCGWRAGKSRLSGMQAAVWFAALGIPGILVYVTGLASPLIRLLLASVFVIPQALLWMSSGTPVDFMSLTTAWGDLLQGLTVVMYRLGEWSEGLAAGRTVTDPVIAGLAWSIMLWSVGAWSGWHLGRNRQALRALTPGGIVIALLLDYTGKEAALMILYLAIVITLIGISRYEALHESWRRRGVDYSESIALDSTLVIIPLTVLFVLLAIITPSFSWRDMVERVREAGTSGDGHVAESFGLQASPNVANTDSYRSQGLPRRHLLGTPPEMLQDIVLVIGTGELPPIVGEETVVNVNRYYWRSITYDIYTGAGWASNRAVSDSLPENTPLMEVPSGYRVVNQNVHVLSEEDDRVYWTGTLLQSDMEMEIARRLPAPSNPSPAHYGDILGAITTADEYKIVSLVPQFSADQLRAAGSDYPTEVTSRYLILPESVPERVLSLARELTGMELTPYDRAVAIERYLRAYPYSLEVRPPPPGRDVVDYFLFTLQKGYCDYYASAMVVLARAAGLPARLVVGYANGTYDLAAAQYEVRQMDAHSWTEIYFPGIGWVEFEPTAGLPEIPRVGSPVTDRPAPIIGSDDSIGAWLTEQWPFLVSSAAGKVLLGLAGLIVSFALWQVGDNLFLILSPSRSVVRRLYARLEKRAARLLPGLPHGHTPHELGSSLTYMLDSTMHRLLRRMLIPAADDIEQIVSLYEIQVFSQRNPSRSQVRAGIRAWARLRWRLWITQWGNKDTRRLDWNRRLHPDMKSARV